MTLPSEAPAHLPQLKPTFRKSFSNDLTKYYPLLWAGDLAFEWQGGWSWPCFDLSCSMGISKEIDNVMISTEKKLSSKDWSGDF